MSTVQPGGRRRRVRRVLMLLGLAPLLVALVLVLKVGSMLYLNHTGRDDLAGGRLAAAVDAFEQAQGLNVLEPWVAPYDLGTALYLQEEYAQSRDRFTEALRTVPAAEECRVRTNLALADEALGDAALAEGDAAGARSAWTEARDALAARECAGSNPTSVPSRAASRVAQRLQDKLATTVAPAPAVQTSPPDPDDTLDQRNQRAEEQRHRREQHHQDVAEQSSGQAPDYQW